MTKLIEYLNNSELGKKLLQKINNLEKFIGPILKKIEELFPDCTKHDITHSKYLINVLNDIIPDKIKSSMNEFEIYFLLYSVYLHDVGMCELKEYIEDKNIKNYKTKDGLKNYIRENHHIRSKIFVTTNFKTLQIDDPHQAKIIGDICQGHRKVDLTDYYLDYKYNYDSIPYSINIALLSCYLRIADELDLSYERVPSKWKENNFPENKISKEHWDTHLSISGVGLKKGDELTIKCSCKCEDPDIHRILKNLEIKINNQIKELPNYIPKYSNIIPRIFEMDIASINYIPYDVRFQIEDAELLKYLTHQLYESEEYAIRELLKNSIDTCRLQNQICERESREYNPLVKFSLNKNKTLIIEDNGTGMNLSIIESYLTSIGKSYYDSSFFKNLECEITPLGELGLGVLSYFLLADRIEIDTKMDNNEPIKLIITGFNEYFYVSKGTRVDRGTKIILYLNDEISRKVKSTRSPSLMQSAFQKQEYEWINYFYIDEILEKYSRHLEIPIKFESEDFSLTISHKEYDITEEPENVYLYKINLIDDKFEGFLYLYRTDERYLRFLNFKDNQPLKFNHTCSYGGIYIGEILLYFRNISFNHVKYEINFKNKAIDLDISRNKIIYNDKFKIMSNKIEKKILEELPKFFENYENFLKNKDLPIGHHLRQYFHDVLIFPDDDSHEELLRKYYYFRIFKKNAIVYKNYEYTIKNLEKLIILDIISQQPEKTILKVDGSIINPKKEFEGNNSQIIDKILSLEDFHEDKEYLIYDFGIIDNLIKQEGVEVKKISLMNNNFLD